MLILVAHNGKTLDLDASGGTRVDAVHRALQSLLGVPPHDQILMCSGVRLDANKTLAFYGLPQAREDAAEAGDERKLKDVFLYRRSLLRPDSGPPAPETMPVVPRDNPDSAEPQGPSLGGPEGGAPEAAGLTGSLARRLAEVQSVCAVSSECHRCCKRLLSEQEVQSMAVDAARANAEVHYKYIRRVFFAFMDRYTALHRAQRELLASFDHDMESLSTTRLHPSVATDERRFLADIVPRQKLQELSVNCRAAAEQFAAKVSEAEGIFADLQQRVEALLLRTPRADLDDLGRQFDKVGERLSDELSLAQRLRAELQTSTERERPSPARRSSDGSEALPEAGAEAEAEAERPAGTDEPDKLMEMRRCDADIRAFLERCVESKNYMTGYVHEQLQQISAQQSQIRDMRNKMAVFQEVALKQRAMFSELCVAGRTLAAYRACLAEVIRRHAFQDMFAQQATQLAERMAALREKEASRHDAFRAHVDPYMPAWMQAGLGLRLPPPLCEVNVRQEHGSLPAVTKEDAQLPPREAKQSKLAASIFGEPVSHPRTAPSKETADTGRAEDPKPVDAALEAMQLQNVRLRADLAAHRAAAFLRSMKADPFLRWDAAVSRSTSPPRGPPKATEAADGGVKPSAAPLEPCRQDQSGDEPREAAFAAAMAAKDEVIQKLQEKLSVQGEHLELLSGRVSSLEGRAAAGTSTEFEDHGTARSHGQGSLALSASAKAPSRSAEHVSADVATGDSSVSGGGGLPEGRKIGGPMAVHDDARVNKEQPESSAAPVLGTTDSLATVTAPAEGPALPRSRDPLGGRGSETGTDATAHPFADAEGPAAPERGEGASLAAASGVEGVDGGVVEGVGGAPAAPVEEPQGADGASGADHLSKSAAYSHPEAPEVGSAREEELADPAMGLPGGEAARQAAGGGSSAAAAAAEPEAEASSVPLLGPAPTEQGGCGEGHQSGAEAEQAPTRAPGQLREHRGGAGSIQATQRGGPSADCLSPIGTNQTEGDQQIACDPPPAEDHPAARQTAILPELEGPAEGLPALATRLEQGHSSGMSAPTPEDHAGADKPPAAAAAAVSSAFAGDAGSADSFDTAEEASDEASHAAL
uniref:Ubiquitin-like domain-containing protein n=1 Tax=Tetraselmis sp. GSL018 TaxID=582737 RepID=A0A061QRQ6_9CHLO